MINQKKMIIPLLYGGINPDDVPFYVRNVTYIEVPKDGHYLEKIIKGIKGRHLMPYKLYTIFINWSQLYELVKGFQKNSRVYM